MPLQIFVGPSPRSTPSEGSSSRRPPRVSLLTLIAVLMAAGCSRRTQSPEPERTQAQLLTQPNDGARSGALTQGNGQLISSVAIAALPSVVSVASTRVPEVSVPEMQLPDMFRRFFGPEGPGGPGAMPFPMPPEGPPQRGLGSGVLVARDVVLTNAHVVEDAREIVVTAGDRRVLQATIAGVDPKSDLAVLRITSDTTGLVPIQFADSSQLQLGQIVLAIGYPFGLSGTVTMGIVSAKGRADLGIVDYEDFLQTDAAINPGNSGGALIDLSGKLVGIPTAILSRSGGNMGVGFAIPSSMARPIMTSLLEHGRVTRGFLGVSIQTLDAALARALDIESTEGVLISEVTPGSPAEQAGLRRGDVVLGVNGRTVSSTGALRNLIASAGPTEVELEILREGKRQKLRVQLTEMPEERQPRAEEPAPQGGPTPAGLRLAPLDPLARQRLELPPAISRGVVVNAVQRGSAAAEAGLQPGDVILEIDKQPVESPQAFAQRWGSTNKPLALLVWREQRTFFVVLKR